MIKQILHAAAMCQSMFCALPFPYKGWDEKARGLMLVFLPLIGLEIGLIWAGLAWLLYFLSLPKLICGVILCAYPFFVTGFLHLDGFMDVVDAVRSWRSLDRKREILKDSHVGSFSVIACILLITAQFACFASLKSDAPIQILIFIPVVSRCCSAFAVTALPSMSTSQYASVERKKWMLMLLSFTLAIAIALGFFICGKYGFALLGCVIGYGLSLLRGYISLEGMNGDISGYALSIGELCSILIFVLL